MTARIVYHVGGLPVPLTQATPVRGLNMALLRVDYPGVAGQLWERVAEGRVKPRWTIRVGGTLHFYPNKRAAFHAFGHLPAGAKLIPPEEDL